MGRASASSIVLAVALVLVAGCGSSSPTASSGTEAVNQTFTGTLSDGSLVTLSFGSGAQALRAALMAAPSGTEATSTVQVTGTLTRPDGSTVALTGTYDTSTKQFSISGGEYQFSGTYDGGAVQAAATVAGVTVKLVAMMGAASSITQYCGTYTTAAQETGSFNIVLSGGKAFGVAQGGVSFRGTSSGSSISMQDDRGRPISATVSGSSVSGTFTTSDGQGSFSGTVEACTAILNKGGQPPQATCVPPATNPAGASQDKNTTTSSGPPAAGGTVLDGTYDLFMSVYYAQSSSNTTASVDRRRLVISGSTIDVTVSDVSTIGRFLGNVVVNTTAKTLDITVTCSSDPVAMPVGASLSFPYTVDTSSIPGSTLLKFETASRSTGLPKEEIYKLQ